MLCKKDIVENIIKKVIVVLVFGASFTLFATETVPTILNFRIENGQSSRVYFDSNTEIEAGTVTGFKITNKLILNITVISGKTYGHYFTVTTPFTFWDNNTIRYEGGSDLKNNGGKMLPKFDLHYIDNNIIEPSSPIDRYVTVTGAGSHNGTLGNEWTLSEACTNASSGMCVWIEKGDYGSGNFIIANNGTADAPIQFIGYKDVPGDNPTLPFVPTTSFSAAEMPYIHTTSTSGNGLDISYKEYIIISNIQVEGYYYTIKTDNSNYTILDNVYARGGFGVIYGNANSYGTNQRIINSYASNATGWGIVTSGRGHLIEDCYISSNYNVGMDYQISVNGNNIADSGQHIIRGNTIYHSPLESDHRGHGITLYGMKPHSWSLVENCTVTNIRQCLEARRNLVNDCTWRNIDIISDGYKGNIAINISSARRNVFDNIRMEDGEVAITFYVANISNDPHAVDKGRDNLIKNCIFKGGSTIIRIDEDMEGLGRTLYGNIIKDCTFSDFRWVFQTLSNDPVGPGNIIKQSSIEETPLLDYEYTKPGPHNFTFENSNFWKSFRTPSGDGNTAVNPRSN
jgi:hypothetical protein